MKATPAQYALAWYQAVKEQPKQQKQISLRMLDRLLIQGRLSQLPRILGALERLEDADQGIVSATARVSRSQLSSQLEAAAKTLLGSKKVRLAIAEDKELIGGFVLETEDRRWDVSVKKQLQNLRARL